VNDASPQPGPLRGLVLVTGATGYVGGRLISRIETMGVPLRCMARRPSALAGRVQPTTEVVHGDVTEPLTLVSACAGVETAYYLIHSLGAAGDFESREVEGARNFAEAAREAGVKKIVYLGGLATSESRQSAHMRSRHAVGRILRDSGVPTIEFRASVIVGAGSLSFELVRCLVRRLPVMIVPKWVRVKAQPIAVSDVLDYLLAARDRTTHVSEIFEIGGSEQVSYLGLMQRYGDIAGLKRLYINVPVLSPRLSSLWLNLVTPFFARVGRKLIDSVSVASVVTDDAAMSAFNVRPMNVTDAIQRALEEEDREFVETHWSDALSSSEPQSYGGERGGSRVVDSRVIHVDANPEAAYAVIERIGGGTGWYYADWLWSLRGILDRFAGGVGMARGRRDAKTLRLGDVVDCWRVEAIEPGERILFRAEMKVFGRAWLQFEVNPEKEGVEIRQTAVYDPHGLPGLVYWYSVYPLHQLVFAGMLRGIAQAATDSEHGEPVARPRKVRAASTLPDSGSNTDTS